MHRAIPHAQSLFLFPTVFGINYYLKIPQQVNKNLMEGSPETVRYKHKIRADQKKE